MVINNKVQKESKLVKSAAKNLGQFKFSFKDPEFYDEFDPVMNLCVVVPFGEDFLLVEVSNLDDNLKINLRLTGIISNEDLSLGLNAHYLSDIISVGELTLHETVIVSYCEHLRLAMSDYSINIIKLDPNVFNIRDLEIICSKALKRFMCDRLFVTYKDFYTSGDLALIG